MPRGGIGGAKKGACVNLQIHMLESERGRTAHM